MKPAQTKLNIAPPSARPNKYHAIAQTIKERIIAGELTHRLPSVPQMAEEFSVTLVTMQKALDLLKEDGCVHAIPGKGSFITRLKRPRTHTIGAVISSTGPLGIALTKGIQDRCAELHQSILVENYGYRKTMGAKRIQRIIEREQVDGFIIWPNQAEEDVEEIIKIIEASSTPYVITPVVDFQKYTQSTTVSNSDSAPTADIMTHLIGTGHKKIGYATNPIVAQTDFNQRRYHQYLRSLQISGLPTFKPLNIEAEANDKAKRNSLKKIQELDAIFCANDTVALPIISLCLANGIKIPGDLALASFDNTQVAAGLEITSVEQHFDKIGKRAVDLLHQEIDGKRTNPAHEIIESELIIRNSSRLS